MEDVDPEEILASYRRMRPNSDHVEPRRQRPDRHRQPASRLHDELGLALLVISHDMALVAQLASRIVVLDHGMVVEQGHPHQLLTRSRQPDRSGRASGNPLPLIDDA